MSCLSPFSFALAGSVARVNPWMTPEGTSWSPSAIPSQVMSVPSVTYRTSEPPKEIISYRTAKMAAGGLMVAGAIIFFLLKHRARRRTEGELSAFLNFLTRKPDHIEVRSFEGMTGADCYQHIVATRGAGIEMTSESIAAVPIPSMGMDSSPYGAIEIKRAARSASDVMGYTVSFRLKGFEFEEVLLTSDGSRIEKLHVEAVKVYRATGSAHKTFLWLQGAIEEIRKGTL